MESATSTVEKTTIEEHAEAAGGQMDDGGAERSGNEESSRASTGVTSRLSGLLADFTHDAIVEREAEPESILGGDPKIEDDPWDLEITQEEFEAKAVDQGEDQDEAETEETKTEDQGEAETEEDEAAAGNEATAFVDDGVTEDPADRAARIALERLADALSRGKTVKEAAEEAKEPSGKAAAAATAPSTDRKQVNYQALEDERNQAVADFDIDKALKIERQIALASIGEAVSQILDEKLGAFSAAFGKVNEAIREFEPIVAERRAASRPTEDRAFVSNVLTTYAYDDEPTPEIVEELAKRYRKAIDGVEALARERKMPELTKNFQQAAVVLIGREYAKLKRSGIKGSKTETGQPDKRRSVDGRFSAQAGQPVRITPTKSGAAQGRRARPDPNDLASFRV